MHAPRLEKVLAAPRLPSLPTVAMRVIELTERPDVSLKELAQTIQNDQGLSAKVLKTVNSSFYGLPKKCSTINQAMVALGIHAVKTLALGFSLVNMIKDGQGEGFDYADYWRRGVYSGVGARTIASSAKIGVDPEEVFLAGILQDVGMVALFQAFGEEYLSVLRDAGDSHRALAGLEHKALELTHAEVSAELAMRWKLPESLLAPIRFHDRPGSGPNEHVNAIRCLALGNIAAEALADHDMPANLARFRDKASQWFALDAAQSEDLLKRIGVASKELASVLRVDVGSAPPAEEILARASEQLVSISMQTERQAESLAQENAELQRAAVTDSLTGAANRKRFNEAIGETFESARSDVVAGAVSVLFFDADKFKSVNDSHGHQAGDLVLIELAARMRKQFEPQGGIVCRYGGEEFAVILPGKARADAARVADMFRQHQASTPIDISLAGAAVKELNVTVSIGVAGIDPTCLDAFPTAESMVRAADQAVYAAKGSGRNCVRVFNPKPKVIPNAA